MRVLAIVLVAGCTTETVAEVGPRIIGLSLDENPPTVAFVPGTELAFSVQWSALCRTNGLPDTSTTSTCEEQDFTARVRCDGAPCELDPPGASSGIALKGSGHISVWATGPGDLTLEVTLEHQDTHEQFVRRGLLAIRDLERVVIDCIYQAYDPMTPRCEQQPGYILCKDLPWLVCPDRATVDPVWGTPISIWIYGEGGGFPIASTMTIPVHERALIPSVTFAGSVQPAPTDYPQGGHVDMRARSNALMFRAEPKATGLVSMHAALDVFGADAVMLLE